MPDVTLRLATPSDAGAIARIQLETWRATYSHLNPSLADGFDLERTASNWAKAAVDPAHRLRLADHDGAPVGYAASGAIEGDEAGGAGELHAVYVLPDAHGLGAGRLLVEDALFGLAQMGYAECVLWVAEQNEAAQGFYRHLGFHADDARDVWRGLPVVRYRVDTPPVRLA